jgi:hypothetical protein
MPSGMRWRFDGLDDLIDVGEALAADWRTLDGRRRISRKVLRCHRPSDANARFFTAIPKYQKKSHVLKRTWVFFEDHNAAPDTQV